jgi:predicted anti-sigma-YlaC factor YlaD
MSGLQRAMRHPDRRSDAHAHARALASDRLLAPLSGEDAAWLRDHLEACPQCRRMADSFAGDRARILALRDELPVPPRDLGARLSRALDIEVRRAVREDARRGGRSLLGSPSFALAGIAVAAVLAVFFLPLALAGLGIGNAPTVPGPGGSGAPAATPMTVATQAVAWVQRQPDGSYVLNSASVDRVCPGLDASACGTLDGATRQLVALTVKPSAVLLQHNGTSAVLVSRDALYAFTVPREASVTPTPVPSSSIPTPGALSPTPAVTGVGATPPAATPVPTGSTGPRPTRTPPPASAVPAASASAGPTAPGSTASLVPTATQSGEPAATLLASEVPTPAASIVSIPPASPAPSAAVTTPIIESVVLVGAPPAYSTDGQWVAFSARPTDGTQGPDIYVWHVGDAKARPLTTDHASVFSAWDVDQILGSAVLPAGSPVSGTPVVTIAAPESPAPESPAPESPAPESPAFESPAFESPAFESAQPSATPAPSPSASAAVPTESATPDTTPSPAVASAPPSGPVVSFLLDPSTGAQTPITRPAIWRPVVDPTNRSVVFWTGDQALDPATNTWIPTSGRLVTADWQALVGPGEVTATPLPGSAGLAGATDWDVRWDPSGRHLAVWIADATDSSTGRLSLFTVNADGSVGQTLLADIAALPGLSLGSDRLAWASPPGQNGQGSTISVYAWSEDGAGSLHGAPDPGSDELIVAH